MKNFYNTFPSPVIAYVTHSSLYIPKQVMPNLDTVSGWGTYSVTASCPTGKIYIYFKVASSSGVDNFGDSVGTPATLGCY